MPNPSNWPARYGAALLAIGCGMVLVLILVLLAIGYFIRALGTVLVNLATFAQSKLMAFISWADRKFFPPGTAAAGSGSNEPETNSS